MNGLDLHRFQRGNQSASRIELGRLTFHVELRIKVSPTEVTVEALRPGGMENSSSREGGSAPQARRMY